METYVTSLMLILPKIFPVQILVIYYGQLSLDQMIMTWRSGYSYEISIYYQHWCVNADNTVGQSCRDRTTSNEDPMVALVH